MPNEASAASSQRVNETTHEKKKVKKYTEWSSYKRVSQNLNTKGAKGGSSFTISGVQIAKGN